MDSEPIKLHRPNWLWKLLAWCELKKLERELRSSRRFQRFCEENHFVHLAEIEKTHQTQISEKFTWLKKKREVLAATKAPSSGF